MKNDDKNDKSISVSDELLKQRRLFLFGTIDKEKAEDIIKKLYVLDEESSQQIQIHINGPGGCISAGMSIIDAIKDVGSSVITYVSGDACSMAGLITLSGDHRVITSRSQLMLHPASNGGNGSDYFSYQRDRMRMLDISEEQINRLLKQYTKLSPIEIKTIWHKEVWYTPEESLEKGLVDEIKEL